MIRRRLLVNFRVDPAVIAKLLPSRLQPKLHRDHAIAGICLIRLEQIRPPFVPIPYGLSSENAAHRIAVVRDASDEAVFIPRRDSDSWMNHALGGRVFPGRHHRARFVVRDDGVQVELAMASHDGAVRVAVAGRTTHELPKSSVFGSLAEASRFFERGSLGYSATDDPNRFDAIVLETEGWRVEALAVSTVSSSFFEDRTRFPEGSVAFDHALIMRDVEHAWRSAPDLYGAEARDATSASAGWIARPESGLTRETPCST